MATVRAKGVVLWTLAVLPRAWPAEAGSKNSLWENPEPALIAVFRLYTDDGTRILQVYGSPAYQRHEFRALQGLGGISGVPVLLDRFEDENITWALFADAGKWNLGSLLENEGLARRAGEILQVIHNSGAKV
jgi:hypothetical protein